MSSPEKVWRTINGAKVLVTPKGDVFLGMGKKVGHITKDEFRAAVMAMYNGNNLEKNRAFTLVEKWTDAVYDDRREGPEAKEINKIIDENPELRWNNGELYRTVSSKIEDFNQLSVGDEIDMRGTSSWTDDIDTAMTFSHIGKRSGQEGRVPVMFVDQTRGTRNAISLQSVSLFPSEQEVAYSGKSKFIIKSIEPNKLDSIMGERIHHVYVEEKKG